MKTKVVFPEQWYKIRRNVKMFPYIPTQPQYEEVVAKWPEYGEGTYLFIGADKKYFYFQHDALVFKVAK